MIMETPYENPSTPSPTTDASRYALVELHLHLDGSLSAEDVMLMAKEEGVDVPSTTKEIYDLLSCPEDCKDLNRYLKCFRLPLSVMQMPSTIAYSVESLVKRLDEMQLLYAEIRFAPQQHVEKGLSQDEVVRAAIDGLKSGLAGCVNGFKANLILSCMRGRGNETENMETVHLGEKYLGDGVCGIDLAGAEALYPTEDFRELFEHAHAIGVPFTIHSGEAAGVESMRHAIDFGTRRIGHGIRSHDNEEMKALLKAKDVCLTLCPTSNLQTRALKGVTLLEDYPLSSFLNSGVSINIATDNMTVSNTTLQKEFQRLFDAGILTSAGAEAIVKSAISHSFISEKEKEELRKKAEKRMKMV